MEILYSSSNVTGVTMSKGMKWVGCAGRMRQIRDSQKIVVIWIWYINEIKQKNYEYLVVKG